MRGRELMSGLPRTLILSPDEVRAGDRRAGLRDGRLGREPAWARRRPSWPRTSSCRGIHMVGGGALLKGLDIRLGEGDRGAGAAS